MKLIVFSENNSLRRYLEDLLTSTPHNFQSLDIKEIVLRGKAASFDGLLVDVQSWQRCVSMLKYFGVLEILNSKPIVVFSKSKKPPILKLRSPKAQTGHCSVPPQTEEFYAALQQMSGAMVPA